MKKIYALIFCIILISTSSVSALIDNDTNDKTLEKTTTITPALAIGIMKTIDTTSEYRDYEVSLFCMILFGGQITKFNRGEFIRLYNFNGLDLIFLVVGNCDDWAIIG